MRYRTYLTFDLIGGLLWGVGVCLLGYFLGQIDFIADHLELAILSVVAISLSPMVIEYLRHRRQKSHDAATSSANGSTHGAVEVEGEPVPAEVD
jgi:membrane-associated protein